MDASAHPGQQRQIRGAAVDGACAILTTQIVVQPLRALATDPTTHPRGQHHLSAASGLVCRNGLAYVIADDEHHLAVFRERQTFGELHRILPGDLPAQKGTRKKRKPDFETLFSLPALGASFPASLIALGSGSRHNRNTGVAIPLGNNGRPLREIGRFDLTPVYEPLGALLGAINIEGAMIAGGKWILLNRGITGKTDNVVIRYRLPDLHAVIKGHATVIKPVSIQRFPLPSIGGVSLGFTDGAALPDGRWLFTAVAENTRDSYADGPCLGSAVGLVSAQGDLLALHRIEPPVKAEGIDAIVDNLGIAFCLVTDTDDPSQSSWLFQGRI
ncbi:MAG: DUF6929 family protein [Burkholderiales bacterium]